MDGLCNWLDACIKNLGVDPLLLEGKVQRLLDAINLLYVFFFYFCPSHFKTNVLNTEERPPPLRQPLNVHVNWLQLHALFLAHCLQQYQNPIPNQYLLKPLSALDTSSFSLPINLHTHHIHLDCIKTNRYHGTSFCVPVKQARRR